MSLLSHLGDEILDVAGLLNRVYQTVQQKTGSRQLPEIWGTDQGRGHQLEQAAA